MQRFSFSSSPILGFRQGAQKVELVDNERLQDYYSFQWLKIMSSKTYEKRILLWKTQAQMVAFTLTHQPLVEDYFLLQMIQSQVIYTSTCF